MYGRRIENMITPPYGIILLYSWEQTKFKDIQIEIYMHKFTGICEP